MVFSTSNYGDFFYDVVCTRAQRGVPGGGRAHRSPTISAGTTSSIGIPTYVVGVAAGLMSKSGKLGYVGFVPGAVGLHQHQRLPDGRADRQSERDPAGDQHQFVVRSARRRAGRHRADRQWLRLPVRHHGRGRLSAGRRAARRVRPRCGTPTSAATARNPTSVRSSSTGRLTMSSRRQAPCRAPGHGSSTLLPMGAGIDRDAWGEKVPMAVAAEGRRRPHQDPGRLQSVRRSSSRTTRARSGSRPARPWTDMELYNWDWSVEGVFGPDK